LAQQVGESVVKTGRFEEDLYAAGGSVTVRAEARDDVLVAGGTVVVDGQVGGGVLAAGGQVDVGAKVANDVRAAGGTVRLTGEVGDEAMLAGGNVAMLPGSSVRGRAWLAGGLVEMAGRVGKLRAAGSKVVVSGEVAGDAELAAERVEIRPTARIHGDLSYASSKEARIDPGARIDGKVTRRAAEGPERGLGGRIAWGVAWLAGLFLAALVLLFLFPRFSVAAARDMEAEPARCLGLGLLLLLGLPVAVVFLFVTVVGIPLGLAGLALYPVLLLAGYLTAAVALGDAGLRRLAKETDPTTAKRLLSIAAALLLLRLARLVPIAGVVVLFAVLLFGLGALALGGYRTYRGAGGAKLAAAGPAPRAG
jgi:cytoskeletal protein CcmA (bactofilin family)